MSDREQLTLIASSLTDPEAEERAKELLLKEIYSSLPENWSRIAPNKGILANLPSCVNEGQCPDDKKLTYNAIRLMLARYITRDESGEPVETPSMVYRRVAEGFSDRIDPNTFYRMMLEGRFLPNSPTLFNMYVNGARGALSACYVTPVKDDMQAIMDAASTQAMTFKWGGGQGFSFSELRPRWDIVRGTTSYSSGPISFMKIYDAVTDAVKQGGKRRGANMGILHIWHPDIYNPFFDPIDAYVASLPPQIRELLKATKKLIDSIEKDGYEVNPSLKKLVNELGSKAGVTPPEEAGFIQAKEGYLGDAFLTNFNISVAINDAFMKAVLDGSEWWMINPRLTGYAIHRSFSYATGSGRTGILYTTRGIGPENGVHAYEDVIKAGLIRALKELTKRGMNPATKNPIAWKHPARNIWAKIIENAWKSGDPGVLYLDNHNKWIETPWLGLISATNPCGEEALYPYESCNLGSINLEKYVVKGEDGHRFDVEALAEDIEFATDVLDAVIDKNKHPVPEQEIVNKLTRKIGLGYMGLAAALARLGIPYDSDEAVAVTYVLYALLEAVSWKRSWELAAKYGHAPAFECWRFNWDRLECEEEVDPEVTLPLFTPALVKAGEVVRHENGWVILKYHDVKIPPEIKAKLEPSVRERIRWEGAIKLMPEEVLEEVAEKYFGVTKKHLAEALCPSADPVAIAKSTKHLLALAIWAPRKAWEVLTEYGKSLGAKAPRHTATTTTAPTGSISILAGTSSGIEPFFALVFKRVVSVGEFLDYVRPFRDDILRLAEETGTPKEIVREVMEIISRHKGSLRWALDEVRDYLIRHGIANGFLAGIERLAKKYATAMDFLLWYHIAIQVAAQVYVDQSISKTINLPKDAPPEHVETAYLVGWLAGLKGVTVYRDESKAVQVIQYGASETGEEWIIRKKTMKKPLTGIGLKRLTGGRKLSEVIMEMDRNSTCETCDL